MLLLMRRVINKGYALKGYMALASSYAGRKNTHFKKNSPKLPSLHVWKGITIGELATNSNRDSDAIIRYVCDANKNIAKYNPSLQTRLLSERFLHQLVEVLGFKPIFKDDPSKKQSSKVVDEEKEDKDIHPRPPPPPSECVPRPPVVAIMGHVDHGKTTLLDALRKSSIVDTEFGGITQHLRAFSVPLPHYKTDDPFKSITFLDTPGHSTFSAIRARGATVTDIVILVVAADDGVMPQTVESIRFAQNARTDIIVAINKIDKPTARPDLVLSELANHGVICEQMGGDVQSVEISALKRLNLPQLLECIVTQAELRGIAADKTGPCEAIVLEVKTLQGLGKIATLLITRGTLNQLSNKSSGTLVSSESMCRPRVILNEFGQKVSHALPGLVVDVSGWDSLPTAGEFVLEVPSESRAQEVVRYRRSSRMQLKAQNELEKVEAKAADLKERYDELRKNRDYHRKKAPVLKVGCDESALKLSVLIKVDVHGSMEAIRDLLETCPQDQISVDIVHIGVGPLTEAEVSSQAIPFGAEVFLFNTNCLPEARDLCQQSNLFIHEHRVIYHFANHVKSLMNGKLPTLKEREIVGEGVVQQMFEITESGNKKKKLLIAGSRCKTGQLFMTKGLDNLSYTDSAQPGIIYYRLMRASENGDESSWDVVEDRLVAKSLRHKTQSVDSVKQDVECGLSLAQVTRGGRLETFENIKPGDRLECYKIFETPQTIEWDLGFSADTVDKLCST